MSGAEAAIAGIGFLCNAMQIVTFARDILHVYKHVRNEHCPDPRLKAYLESAKACFDDMNSSASATSQALPPSRDQQQIIKIGKKLEESMTQLQSKFSELHVDDASRRGFRGKMRIVSKSMASLWKGKELESLEVNLKRYESLLHRVVLHRICNQSQAAEISSKQSFNKLDANLQSIITQLADGCTRISGLSAESFKTRNLVTQEHGATRAAIDAGFATTQGSISSFRDSMTQGFQDIALRDQSNGFEKKRNELLRSIRFPEMDSRKNHISENYPGTFDWVFKSPEDSPMSVNITRSSNLNYFPAWLESDAQKFWISGKPASGKSSLVKFLVTHPLTLQHLQAQHSNIQILTHYFWKPGQPLQKNIEGMTRSLLHQVLHKNRGVAQRLWTEQSAIQDKRDRGDWDVNELRNALCWAIKSSGNHVCIFLDGLDEAKEFEDLPWGDNQKTQVVYDLLSLDKVKLCASSREEDPFCRFFADQPCLRTHQLNENDIRHYAKNSLELSGLCSDHRHQLLATVVEKANGVFLWVVLAVESLNRAIRSGGVHEFEERLSQTPSDLHDLLVDMWNRPGDDAKLSTYSTEASFFFNLALAAIDMEEKSCIFGDLSEIGSAQSMRSLLVITTAIENKPFISMLSDGQEIQTKELQARCARVEDRMRSVCRGLLEVTVAEDAVYHHYAGDETLLGYVFKRVEFIHRCAFDFITDTQFGHKCLARCHWSSTEKVQRLFAGYLVKSRFLCMKSRCYDWNMWNGKTHHGADFDGHQLTPLLDIILNWTGWNTPLRNTMFKIIRNWQQKGLFYDHMYWRHPTLINVPSNSRELEFLDHVTRVAASEEDVINLVDQLSIVRLTEAIPVLLRALTDFERVLLPKGGKMFPHKVNMT
ncbi:hypothetical protein FBULB1_14226 [Fusarium bulbicola]|nr:hypothetical protein FBULB1_14226 [Fusarium bulbicola]